MIVITSCDPSDDKTTVSVNLAAALAENGAKVLLIDADLRHPSVAERLGLEGGAGLAHVLSGQATVTSSSVIGSRICTSCRPVPSRRTPRCC